MQEQSLRDKVSTLIGAIDTGDEQTARTITADLGTYILFGLSRMANAQERIADALEKIAVDQTRLSDIFAAEAERDGMFIREGKTSLKSDS